MPIYDSDDSRQHPARQMTTFSHNSVQPILLTLMITTKQMLVFEGSKVWWELLQSKRRHKKGWKESMILKLFAGPDILALVIKHLEGLSQRITNLQLPSTI